MTRSRKGGSVIAEEIAIFQTASHVTAPCASRSNETEADFAFNKHTWSESGGFSRGAIKDRMRYSAEEIKRSSHLLAAGRHQIRT